MKNRILLLNCFLFLVFVGVSFAQQTAPVRTTMIREDSAVVKTHWDSVYVGPTTNEKWIDIQNLGSATLYIALGNDTTAGSFKRIQPSTGFFLARIAERSFIRTRAAVDSTKRVISFGR